MRIPALLLCGLAAALLVLRPHSARAQADPASASHVLPFAAEDDRDGARFVWFIYGRGPFRYDYVPADRFPRPADFTEVEPRMARAGDVAWWPGWMGIADGEGGVVGAGGRRAVADLTRTYGREPRYFRRLRPDPKP
jgi:hypothetical protein